LIHEGKLKNKKDLKRRILVIFNPLLQMVFQSIDSLDIMRKLKL